MAPSTWLPPAALQQEQNKSTRTCRRPAPSAQANHGPGRGQGAVGTRAERRRGAGASAASASSSSFLPHRPRRPQPPPRRRRRRRRRRPRGMACLMAAFSVGTAMVSLTSFALGAGFYLLGKQEAQSPVHWSSHQPPRSASSECGPGAPWRGSRLPSPPPRPPGASGCFCTGLGRREGGATRSGAGGS